MRNYQAKSNKDGVSDSINAERLGAGEFNSIAEELENAVTTSDQTLAAADGTSEVTDQLAMALSIYGSGGASYHIDTGAANAYVLDPVSPKESPPAYFDGFTVTFIPGNPNTGASTVNIDAIGSKSITTQDGTALSGGEIDGNTTIRYNSSDDRFEILSPYSSVQIFTSSGTYTKPDGLKYVEVTVIGGGGGGGGCLTDATYYKISAGGGGGGSSISSIPAASLSASETVTVGAGGSGGSGNNAGSTGGTSSFGSHISATGGGGGEQMVGVAASQYSEPGAGGAGSSGDINVNGTCGGAGEKVGSVRLYICHGGNTILGAGGHMLDNTNAGVAEDGYQNGGGGSGCAIDPSDASCTGGDGADGIVIVKEFF